MGSALLLHCRTMIHNTQDIKLNDGHSIPQLGFGTFLVDPDEAHRVVTDALEAGYRHIDTAAFYGNEEGVGAAIRDSGIPREEIFVTTKLWNDRHDDAPDALNECLTKLGLDYVDLYLIHWPVPKQDKYLGAWDSLIQLREKALTRSIGVCNFLPEHIDRLVAESGVAPAVNQVELHPWMQQKDTVATNGRHGIATEAWAPLGQFKYDFTQFPALVDAAAAHNATEAQVVLRWHLQNGTIVFPKSRVRERMEENLGALDFTLSDEEMAAINSLDRGEEGRLGFHPNERS
ncbi:oxidoreductase [Corynebacterium renale]|nr:oxidoreductase [Corynebacterium renale]